MVSVHIESTCCCVSAKFLDMTTKILIPLLWYIQECYVIMYLKVLTNEKRGGLTKISINRYPFKLFPLKFSSKSMQAPSCKRPITSQRTLFHSFEIDNCFQITALCRAATSFLHHNIVAPISAHTYLFTTW